MKERPILMSGPMVRPTLADIKTQTRRTRGLERFNERGHFVEMRKDINGVWVAVFGDSIPDDPSTVAVKSPYGGPGNRLWVRETWGLLSYTDETEWYQRSVAGLTEDDVRSQWKVVYAADLLSLYDFWRPSIHMPRWASRLTLEITGVRVERLQDISEADAIAEGATCVPFRPDDGFPICDGWTHLDKATSILHTSAVFSFRRLWESINGGNSWGRNPWVWVVQFKRVTSQ